MLRVHLRINDSATGQPTPVRLQVSSLDGGYFPPLGGVPVFPVGRNEDVGGQVRLGKETFTYIDGACEIPLPSGTPLRIRAFKGLEYEPLDREVTLGVGQMSLRLEIRRWTDSRKQGWYSGDSRAHFLTPHDAWLEAAAEDLAIVNLLACQTSRLAQDGNTYTTISNLLAFSGQAPALERDSHLVVVNTLNRHLSLGKLGLLHAHRVVFPLAFGEPDGSDDWSLLDWCQQCHRKKGLVVWVEPFRGEAGLLGGEALIAAILGKIDAFEFDPLPRTAPLLPWYYRLLNAGLRLPLISGSGKDSNKVALGAMRTCAQLLPEQPLTYTNWIEAVRAGRTVVTNGPLLNLSREGDQIRATAESIVPFERLEIVRNGEVMASQTASSGTVHSARIEFADSMPTSGWIAARAIGGKDSTIYPHHPVFAHSSPLWLEVPGKPFVPETRSRQSLARLVQATREWALQHAQFREEKWRRQLLERADEAVRFLDGS